MTKEEIKKWRLEFKDIKDLYKETIETIKVDKFFLKNKINSFVI